jgi:hypothetical protein
MPWRACSSSGRTYAGPADRYTYPAHADSCPTDGDAGASAGISAAV